MKSNSEIKRLIEAEISAWPERQLRAGLYVHKIGNKFIHITNTWEGGSDFKMTLADFYNVYITKTVDDDESYYIYR